VRTARNVSKSQLSFFYLTKAIVGLGMTLLSRRYARYCRVFLKSSSAVISRKIRHLCTHRAFMFDLIFEGERGERGLDNMDQRFAFWRIEEGEVCDEEEEKEKKTGSYTSPHALVKFMLRK
jgi:hypothetical protein